MKTYLNVDIIRGKKLTKRQKYKKKFKSLGRNLPAFTERIIKNLKKNLRSLMDLRSTKLKDKKRRKDSD